MADHPFESIEGGASLPPQPFVLSAAPASPIQQTTGNSSGVVQRTSAFSTWFIQTVMVPVIRRLPEVMRDDCLRSLVIHLGVLDQEEPEWHVAREFITQIFSELLPDDLIPEVFPLLQTAQTEFQTAVGSRPETPAKTVDTINEHFQLLISAYQDILTVDPGEELAQAQEYVTAKQAEYANSWGEAEEPGLKEALLAGASGLLLSPSSTAHYLDDREETPLSHGPQDHASEYHRSAKHQTFSSSTARVIKNHVGKSALIRKKKEGGGGEAHVGLYPNAATYGRNQRTKPRRIPVPVEEAAPETTPQGNGDLYDASLLYKLQLSQKVAQSVGALDRLSVGVYNDYPLVMVHFDLVRFMQDYDPTGSYHVPTSGTQKAFTQFLMNYYMGLANYHAKNAGVNITIVERSSFGFNTPSVAETQDSFRINMGLMPPVYADVHAHALRTLNVHLNSVLETKASRDPSGSRLDTESPYFDGKTAELNSIDDWLKFAMYPIEIQNKTSIANAVRNRTSLDFVNAKAFDRMAMYAGKACPLGGILGDLFDHMKLAGSLTTDVSPEETHYTAQVPALKQNYAVDEEMDRQYAQVLQLLSNNLVSIGMESQDEVFRHQIYRMSLLLEPENTKIELTLDMINELLLVHSLDSLLRSDRVAPYADGYGSESEVEDEVDEETSGDMDAEDFEEDDEDLSLNGAPAPHRMPAAEDPMDTVPVPAIDSGPRRLTGKKIITHNGMRALLSAVDSAARIVLKMGRGKKALVDVQGAYYEMDDALEAAQIPAEATEDSHLADILVRDINACVTEGPSGATEVTQSLASSPARVWILDSTSSTQAKMAAMAEMFRSSQANVLYFVSSGFKQEQAGSDRNQYGTLRAFTDNTPEGKVMLNAILDQTKKTDHPLALTAHLFRRTMKRFGAVPRNANVLSGATSVHAPKPFTGSATDWDAFGFNMGLDPDFDIGNVATRQRLLDEFRNALALVPVQEDDAGAERADHSQHAREFIYTAPEKSDREENPGAQRSWFAITANQGGGDCLLHALSGRNLTFDQVVATRDQLSASMGDLMADRTVSGSHAYQSLYQSHMTDRRMEQALHGKHQIPINTYRLAIKVPGLYAGEEEIQSFCHLPDQPDEVYVVTHLGELRRVNENGTVLIARVATDGPDQFKQRVRTLLTGGQTVLYKSSNHWERITGVN